MIGFRTTFYNGEKSCNAVAHQPKRYFVFKKCEFRIYFIQNLTKLSQLIIKLDLISLNLHLIQAIFIIDIWKKLIFYLLAQGEELN